MRRFNDIDHQYNKFLKNIDSLTQDSQQQIIEAYKFAKKYHGDQKRQGDIPYVIHPLRVANLLIERLNIREREVIISALLHDVVEDTSATFESIKDKFGTRSALLVNNLTRIKEADETLKNRYEKKLEYFKKLISKDYNTRAIKTCDILDNMMSWRYIPEDHPLRNKFDRWFKEAKTINIPLAKSVDPNLASSMETILSELK